MTRTAGTRRIAATTCLMLTASHLFGQPNLPTLTPEQHEEIAEVGRLLPLMGLKAFDVDVSVVPEDGVLSLDSLRIAIELRLRQFGIPITSKASRDEADATLIINVTTYLIDDNSRFNGLCMYSISVCVRRDVWLSPDALVPYPAAVWCTFKNPATSVDYADTIKKSALESIDNFINDLLAAQAYTKKWEHKSIVTDEKIKRLEEIIEQRKHNETTQPPMSASDKQ